MSSPDYSYFFNLWKYTTLGYLTALILVVVFRSAGVLVIDQESLGMAGFFTGLLGVYVGVNLKVLNDSSLFRKAVVPFLCFAGYPVLFVLGLYSFARLRLEEYGV